MTKKEKEVIGATKIFVQQSMQGDGAAHDFWHVYRVLKQAESLHKKEKGNLFIITLAALLHDIADAKFHNGDTTVGEKVTRQWLTKQDVDKFTVDAVAEIVAHVSFKGGKDIYAWQTIEGKIVQDADRLDALGAIGVARAFAYGGFKKRKMYDPGIKPQTFTSSKEYYASEGTTINHFYEKLLLLQERMNTKTGKKIAQKRHKFLENFLNEFLLEWEGKL